MAVFHRGQYRREGAATWSVLFSLRDATSYGWATAPLPAGTYELQLQAEDTTDNAPSAWSETRTITVAHVPAPTGSLIVSEVQYALNGGTWQSATAYALAETRLHFDTAAIASGASVAVHVRLTDLSDQSAPSPWSETRTFTVAHATPAAQVAVATLSPTRGATAGELATQSGVHYVVHHQIAIRDDDGAWRDLAALGGEDFRSRVTITDGPDQPVVSAQFEFWREVELADGTVLSLSPVMAGSTLNRRSSNGSFAPLIQWGRRVRVWTATLPRGTSPGAGDWVGVFEGYLDDPDWGSATLTVPARDLGARLQDTIIGQAKQYGSADGVAVATVIRQLLADNGFSGETLGVVGDPNWFLRPYEQALGVSVMDALQNIALQFGWTVRYEWTARTTYQLVLYQPSREDVTGATPAVTLSPDRYLDLPSFATLSASVRNVIRGVCIDKATGDTLTAEVRDEDSIARFGVRLSQFTFTAADNIDSAEELNAFLGFAAEDLSQPYVTARVESRFRWALRRGTVVTLAPNDVHHDAAETLAVVAVTHVLEREQQRTTVDLRGRAVGAYSQWLSREAAPGSAELVAPIELRAFAETVSETDTTVTVRLTATATRGTLPTGFVPLLLITELFGGVTLVSGPQVQESAPSGTLWTLGKPTGVAGSFAYEARSPGAISDGDREPVAPVGVVVPSRLTWSEFGIVPVDPAIDQLITHYRGTLVDKDGAATGDATVTLTRTGADTRIDETTPTIGPLPLTIEFDAPRQPFGTGESIVEAYGEAPGVEGDWERVNVPEVSRDTQGALARTSISYVTNFLTGYDQAGVSLELIDPTDRVTLVEWSDRTDLEGAFSAYVADEPDEVGNYFYSVTLEPRKPAQAMYRLTGWDADRVALMTIEERVVEIPLLDNGRALSLAVEINTSTGVATATVMIPAMVRSVGVAFSTAGYPSAADCLPFAQPGGPGETVYDGYSYAWDAPFSVAMGQTVYVSAVGYAQTGGTGAPTDTAIASATFTNTDTFELPSDVARTSEPTNFTAGLSVNGVAVMTTAASFDPDMIAPGTFSGNFNFSGSLAVRGNAVCYLQVSSTSPGTGPSTDEGLIWAVVEPN